MSFPALPWLRLRSIYLYFRVMILHVEVFEEGFLIELNFVEKIDEYKQTDAWRENKELFRKVQEAYNN
jgi:hypothetical protein